MEVSFRGFYLGSGHTRLQEIHLVCGAVVQFYVAVEFLVYK